MPVATRWKNGNTTHNCMKEVKMPIQTQKTNRAICSKMLLFYRKVMIIPIPVKHKSHPLTQATIHR